MAPWPATSRLSPDALSSLKRLPPHIVAMVFEFHMPPFSYTFRNGFLEEFAMYSRQRYRALTDQGIDVHFAIASGECNDVIAAFFDHGNALITNSIEAHHALIRSSTEGNVGLMEILLKHGVDGRATDPAGDGPISIASANGHCHLVQTLIDHGVPLQTPNKMTPLVIAASSGKLNVVRLLTESGAQVFGSFALIQAARNNHIKVVEYLLGHGHEVNGGDNYGRTALWHASRKGYSDLIPMLIEYGANVNASDRSGLTPLIQSAALGHAEPCQLLLAYGADVNRVSNHSTALVAAALNARTEIVTLLLTLGADPDRTAPSGMTPLMVAWRSEIIQLLLSHPKTNIDALSVDGYSALSLAAARGDDENVALLLANGANPNVADRFGRTALMEAVARGAVGATRHLLQSDANIHAVDSLGNNVLHVALHPIFGENVEIVRLLLCYGADDPLSGTATVGKRK